MVRWRISGGHPLEGIVDPDGFKHAFVTAVSAAFLAPQRITIEGAPTHSEAQTLLSLLESVGVATSSTHNSVTIDARGAVSGEFHPELFDAIHGSLYLVPGLLVRTGRAKLRSAGGCQIGADDGSRPIEHYAEVLQRFGAQVSDVGEVSLGREGLHACDIDLADFVIDSDTMTGPLYSGATKFALLCAASAVGTSVLRKPYPKADITEMIAVLRRLGAEVNVDHEQDLLLVSSGSLNAVSVVDVQHPLVPDLMQTLTWLIAGAVTRGQVSVRSSRLDYLMKSLEPELEALRLLGMYPRVEGDLLQLDTTSDDLQAVDLVIRSRGIFSDAQPMLALMMTYAVGTSTIADTVWPDRFGYAEGLSKLGCSVFRVDPGLKVSGPRPPSVGEQCVNGADLRAAVTLAIAATAVPGQTTVLGVEHINRGFSDFAGVLTKLGGCVDVSGG